jgi:thiosulfate dehydrogenase [quinone] large subunit
MMAVMRAPRHVPPVNPAIALAPLRAFLGVTFTYAGIQKLSDPGFLAPGSPTYIGTQLHGFADGTPGGWLLRTFALPHAQVAGVGVALVEIAVGLLVLLGLGTRVAATIGLGLNLLLFLTASWKTRPYFLGSDIVFVFAWLPFALAGSAGQPALEHVLAARSRAPGRRPSVATAGGALTTRREALGAAYGAVGAASLAIAGIAALLKGSARAPARQAIATATPRVRRHRAAARRRATVPAGAVRLGPSSRLPVGSAAVYRDPSDGRADIVVRQPDRSLTACSAICTHAGCRVVYSNNALFCPCHGSLFDSRTGAVIQGPATQPLVTKKVVERGSTIYALPS